MTSVWRREKGERAMVHKTRQGLALVQKAYDALDGLDSDLNEIATRLANSTTELETGLGLLTSSTAKPADGKQNRA